MGRSRTHQSKYKGCKKHGGGKTAPAGKSEGVARTPVPYGRFARYPNGAVPQSKRSPKEQLAHLDKMGWTATKERIKLLAKIKENEKRPKK